MMLTNLSTLLNILMPFNRMGYPGTRPEINTGQNKSVNPQFNHDHREIHRGHPALKYADQ